MMRIVLLCLVAVVGAQKTDSLKEMVMSSKVFKAKEAAFCAHTKPQMKGACQQELLCKIIRRSGPKAAAASRANGCDLTHPRAFMQIDQKVAHKAPEDQLAKEMTHDLEMNFNKIAPFGKEDTAKELQARR